LFPGLRLTRGIRLQKLAAKFGEDTVKQARAAIAELIKGGLMERRWDFVCLTSCGRLLSNDVFEKFILAEESVR
jgi:oxygen-independent coproporphyrinogen III oxidase